MPANILPATHEALAVRGWLVSFLNRGCFIVGAYFSGTGFGDCGCEADGVFAVAIGVSMSR